VFYHLGLTSRAVNWGFRHFLLSTDFATIADEKRKMAAHLFVLFLIVLAIVPEKAFAARRASGTFSNCVYTVAKGDVLIAIADTYAEYIPLTASRSLPCNGKVHVENPKVNKGDFIELW